MRDHDEEALAWAGDDDPSLAVGKEKPVDARPAVPATAARRDVPAFLLVTYGLLSGVYLIYTLGWIVTIQRSSTTLGDLFSEIMFQFGEFLAIASPAIWLFTAFTLTRGAPAITRLMWVLFGLVVVIPWPFVLGV